VNEKDAERFLVARAHSLSRPGPVSCIAPAGAGRAQIGWSNYSRSVEVLAKSFHVLVPDLPGFGGSDKCLPDDRLFTVSGGRRE
jgi:pimeloyl-ACP methyl ester carboxylesterase